jgi:hypothetical protein
MVLFEPLGLDDLCRNVCRAGQCRTGRPGNPDQSLRVRISEVVPAKGCGYIDMGNAMIDGRFHSCSLFCSNRVVPHGSRVAIRRDV